MDHNPCKHNANGICKEYSKEDLVVKCEDVDQKCEEEEDENISSM